MFIKNKYCKWTYESFKTVISMGAKLAEVQLHETPVTKENYSYFTVDENLEILGTNYPGIIHNEEMFYYDGEFYKERPLETIQYPKLITPKSRHLPTYVVAEYYKDGYFYDQRDNQYSPRGWRLAKPNEVGHLT